MSISHILYQASQAIIGRQRDLATLSHNSVTKSNPSITNQLNQQAFYQEINSRRDSEINAQNDTEESLIGHATSKLRGSPPLYRCSSARIPSRSSWVLWSERDSPELQQSPAPASVLTFLLLAFHHHHHFPVPACLLNPYSLPLIFPCLLIATHTHGCILQNQIQRKEHPGILLGSPVCYFKQHLQNSDLTYPPPMFPLPPPPPQCYTAADSFSSISWLLLLHYISLSLVTLIQHVCKKAAT